MATFSFGIHRKSDPQETCTSAQRRTRREHGHAHRASSRPNLPEITLSPTTGPAPRCFSSISRVNSSVNRIVLFFLSAVSVIHQLAQEQVVRKKTLAPAVESTGTPSGKAYSDPLLNTGYIQSYPKSSLDAVSHQRKHLNYGQVRRRSPFSR